MSSTADLSNSDMVKYEIDKRKLFRTTIAISAAYGAVALVLLIITIMGGSSADSLAGDFLPFTLTLVGGMVIVLVLMIIQIATFKPVSAKTAIFNDNLCPDYWVLQKTPDVGDPDFAAATGQAVRDKMLYQCVPDPNIWNYNSTKATGTTPASTITNWTTGTVNNLGYTAAGDNVWVKNINYASGDNANTIPKKPLTRLVDVASTVYNGLYPLNNVAQSSSHVGSSGTTKNLRCDKVYPQYMAAQDKQYYEKDPTQLRCEYAKQCNIPWTGVCPIVQ